MEYYSATKWNEVMSHTAMWMNLKNTMLNKRSQTQGRIVYYSTYVKYPE